LLVTAAGLRFALASGSWGGQEVLPAAVDLLHQGGGLDAEFVQVPE
jgi:hypothetical protein